MEIAVLDIKGKETGRKVQLEDQIFAIEPNSHVVYLEVKQYLAAQRQGTHKTKEKREIKGSTRKLHRQKGTGGSRKGSVKNPLFKGGGRIFGPRPRNYRFKLNKAVKRLAKRSVLSDRARNNAIKVLENFSFDIPKTKEFKTILSNLGVENKKSLFVLGSSNKNVYLSSRNLQHTRVLSYSEISSYHLLNAQEVIFLEDSLDKFQQNLIK